MSYETNKAVVRKDVIKEKERLKHGLLQHDWDYILTFKYGQPTSSSYARDIVENWVWNDTQIERLLFVTERNKDNPQNVHTHVLIDSNNAVDSLSIIRRKVGQIGKVWSEEVRTKRGSLDYLLKYVGWQDAFLPEIDWGVLVREKVK